MPCYFVQTQKPKEAVPTKWLITVSSEQQQIYKNHFDFSLSLALSFFSPLLISIYQSSSPAAEANFVPHSKTAMTLRN